MYGKADFPGADAPGLRARDRKSTRLNSSHSQISYAVFCLKKQKQNRSMSTCFDRSIHSNMHHVIFFFFFNDTATTEIYTLSLHDALPICAVAGEGPLALPSVAGLDDA